jgi:NADPH-dependent glutamate synthase beta subunit-like oxidoreductase
LDQLRNEYDAVFLGVGAQKGVSIDIPGKDAENVYTGVEFLQQVNTGKWVEIGNDVVVIGGGNTAMDCARVAKRLGANVSIVYRRTRMEMPAITAEIDEAVLVESLGVDHSGIDIREDLEFRRATHVVAVAGRAVGDDSLSIALPDLPRFERFDHPFEFGHLPDPFIRLDAHQLSSMLILGKRRL